jgi:hypothetical protein
LGPDFLDPDFLKRVDAVLAIGSDAADLIENLAGLLKAPLPADIPKPGDEEILVWLHKTEQLPHVVTIAAPQQPHRRHRGRYATGDVGEGRSFYFRGPVGAISRPARNLMQFLEIAQEVDDATWEHHLRVKDYSAWFRNVINDAELARRTAEIENDLSLRPGESRRLVRRAVTRRYLGPAHSHQRRRKT